MAHLAINHRQKNLDLPPGQSTTQVVHHEVTTIILNMNTAGKKCELFATPGNFKLKLLQQVGTVHQGNHCLPLTYIILRLDDPLSLTSLQFRLCSFRLRNQDT